MTDSESAYTESVRLLRTAARPIVTAPTHIVGPVPGVARLAAAAGLLAGVLLLAARFLPYADVGGVEVRPPHAPWDIGAALIWSGVLIAAGVSVLLGRLPRLGLTVLAASGALAIGLAVGEAYHLQGTEAHRGVEFFFGQRLVTSSVQPLAGVWVHLAAYLLLLVAVVLTLIAWPRATMEDAGEFDSRRPLAMGLAAIGGLTGVLAVAARPLDTPDLVVQDVTGLRITVPVPGGVSLLDRLGLDLAGGVLLAAAVFLVALLAATLRPRLASVGAFAGLAAYFLTAGLSFLLEAGRYDDVEMAAGGWLHLVTGIGFAALGGYCLRAAAAPPATVAPLPRRAEPIRSEPGPATRRRPRRGAG